MSAASKTSQELPVYTSGFASHAGGSGGGMSGVRLKQVKHARVHAQVRISAPHEVVVLVAGLLVRRHQHAGRQRSHQIGHVLGVGQLVMAPCNPPPLAPLSRAAR